MIVSVVLLWDGRGGNADFQMRRTYTRVYEVWTDSNTDDAVTAGTAPGFLPIMGEPHPEDLAAVVAKRGISQDSATPRRWLVTIEYDTQPADGSQGGQNAQRETLQPTEAGGAQQAPGDRPENPLLRPARWRGSFQQVTEALRSAYKTDEDGNNIGGSVAVLNSAGFKFDPPITIEVSRPVVSLTKNYAVFNLSQVSTLQDAVNLTTWKGFGPRTVRVIGVEWSSAFENGVPFWEVTFNFAIKWDTWDFRALDSGLVERIQTGTDPGTGQPIYEFRQVFDKHGEPITEPIPLDGNGRRLTPGDPEAYKVYSGYPQQNFNLFPF